MTSAPERLRGSDYALVALSLAALVAVGAWLLPRGINLSDEGFLLQQSLDMLHGKVLYRDIEMFIAPGIWFLVAGLFALVEPSVLASRLLAAVSYAALAALIFRLVQREIGGRAGVRAGAACTAVYAALAVWSFPHWTWAWYSPYSILFALLAMQGVLAWRGDPRPVRLLWVGACIGLTAIFKQNYGFFALAGCALGVLAVRIEARGAREEQQQKEPLRALARSTLVDGLRIAAGVLIAVLPLVVYFGAHGALWSIYDRFFLYPLEFTTAANIPYLPFSALFDHALFADRVTSTNYLSQLALSSPAEIAFLPGPTAIHVLHALLYWLPPCVLAAGAALSFRRESGRIALDAPLFVSTAMSGLLFLGVFPRADFTHLVTVYQPLLVTAALVWHRASQRLSARGAHRPPWWTWLPLAGGIALAGFYALAAGAWLAYLVESMTERLPQQRGGVLVHKITAVGINQLVEVVRDHTSEDEPFFGLPDMAMINFLAERPVPGSQYQTYAHMIARDEGALTTSQLEAAAVDFAIARYDNVLSTEPRLARYAPILADYLERNFEATWMIQNDQYLMLERREAPREPVRRESVLGDCTFAGGNAPPSSVREHLLFASLFQPLEPDAIIQSAETRCRVHIPEGAVLAVQIGYKRPIGIERGASLVAEILADTGDGEPEPLLRETLAVQKMNVDGVRVPETRRIDFGWFPGLSGRDVTLVFRTERRGRVKLSPFTLETYAMFWQNPVLELGEFAGLPKPAPDEAAAPPPQAPPADH